MEKRYQILVFGKKGCDKCKVLNQRLDAMLSRPEWAAFEKHYVDVLTEDGLVEFAKMECLNPQRIPAFIVGRKQPGGAFTPLLNPSPGASDEVCGSSKLFAVLGLQTDYSESGRGVITPGMVTKVLQESLAC